jgi:MFS family permease
MSDRFAALTSSRRYRRYFAGQTVAQAGTWMQVVAQSWLVLQISDSGTAVGLLLSFQFLPVLLFAPLAGVFVDRFDKRRLLVLTQLLFVAQAAGLGVLVVTDVAELWMVYAAATVFGLVTAIDFPARQIFLFDLLDETHVPNAVSLNTINMNVSRVIGPALAAVVIAFVGVGACFLLNAACCLILAGVLVSLRTNERAAARPQPRERGQLREGFRYVWRTPELRVPLVMLFVIGSLAYEFQVSLPMLAKFTFESGASTYAAMTAAMGVGSILGGLAVAGRDQHGTGAMVRQAMLFGALILGIALSPTLPVAIAAIVAMGSASVVMISRSMTTMQLGALPEFRGRVMALVTVAFFGTTPIGGPIIGWIGEVFGARWSLATSAAACFVAAAYGWLHRPEVTAQPLDDASTPSPAPI